MYRCMMSDSLPGSHFLLGHSLLIGQAICKGKPGQTQDFNTIYGA